MNIEKCLQCNIFNKLLQTVLLLIIKQNSMKKIDGYTIFMKNCLGKGSYGDVYLGTNDKTGQKVAVKIINKSSIQADQYMKNALKSQIKIMENIKSENIVGLYDVMESSKNYYIIQELCNGDLTSIIKPALIIPQKKAKQYLFQIANGFLVLVREGVIHRDLKPANVMLKNDKIKIGDFGFAKKSQAANKKIKQSIVGSPLYMSLQLLKNLPYSSKCDIWALGFIFYEMLHGCPPWNGKNQYELIKKIETKPLELNENLSNDTKDFLRKCLGIIQTKRISWDQFFIHPIFNGYFLSKQKENPQFENKLKMIMNDLRFQINSQNIDLCKILARLGYKNGQNELDKTKFFRFLKIICPDISRQVSDYIFIKTDYDKSGSISINQIERIMDENNINLTTANQKIPGFTKNEDKTQSFTHIPENLDFKIKACFTKLMSQLILNKYSLKDMFDKYDKEKSGSLNRDDFKKMLKSINENLQNDEIDAAFNLIDKDNSNSIEYNELNNYYTKVNGISRIEKKISLDILIDEQESKNQKLNNSADNNLPSNINPLNVLANTCGNYNLQSPTFGYYPKPKPNAKNNKVFDNFIMNHLYNNTNMQKKNSSS